MLAFKILWMLFFCNATLLERNNLQEQRDKGEVIGCVKEDSTQKSVASLKAKVYKAADFASSNVLPSLYLLS